MRDIGLRIQRYRLSRYAPPRDPIRRRLRLVWVIAALWIVWVGFLSDHSFYRLWRIERQNSQAQRDLSRVRRETAQRDAEVNDPEASRLRAEHWLREQGGMAGRGEIVYRIRDARNDSLGR